MAAAVDWVSRLHFSLNRILEAHASGEANLPPTHFLSCPVGLESPEGQVEQVKRWFTRLWNETLSSKMAASLREGLQLYGHRCQWEDPVQHVQDTWPWSQSSPLTGLTKINPDDVGYDFKKFPAASSVDIVNPGVLTMQNNERPSSTGTSLSSGTTGSGSGSGTNGTNNDSDPLFNMLLHLQEAAAANK